MAWIEVHQALIDHRKVANASASLGRSCSPTTLIGHMVTLWCWGLDNAPEGGPLTAAEVAHGARWQKDADGFAAALLSSGLIDLDEQGYWLHDWRDYAGRLIEKRKADAERKRTKRGQPAGHPPDIRGTARVTQPNPTQPNLRERDHAGPVSISAVREGKQNPEAPALYGLLVGAGIQRPPDGWVEGWLARGRSPERIREAIQSMSERAGKPNTRYVDAILESDDERTTGGGAGASTSRADSWSPRQRRLAVVGSGRGEAAARSEYADDF